MVKARLGSAWWAYSGNLPHAGSSRWEIIASKHDAVRRTSQITTKYFKSCVILVAFLSNMQRNDLRMGLEIVLEEEEICS